MLKQLRTAAIALSALAFPIVGFADVSGTPTLTAGQMLNLDTGAVASTGGDLLWTGTSLTPQAGVTAFSLPGAASLYDSLTESTLSTFSSFFTSAPITPVAVNTGIAVKSKGGKLAKLLVTAVSGTSITVKFTTYGATGGGGGGTPGGPSISTVQNNYSQILVGLPNYGIAPGTLFFIQGSALANATTDLLSSASPGLQTTVQGVSVTVTSGTTSLPCPLYYLSPTQVDAVLPEATPVGPATIIITNNGSASAAFAITVVQSAFGIISYGGGLGAAYDANNNLLTTANAANPNQTIVLWGSGIGQDSQNDDKVFPQKQNNLTGTPVTAYIGGVQANIAYRGRSQYPGVDQVVLAIPGSVPTGCFVSVAIVSGNIVSNTVTIPVAASGKTCSDSSTGLTSDQIQNLTGKTTIKEGLLSISQTTSITSQGTQTTNGVIGSFQSISGFSAGVGGGGTVSIGSCFVSASQATSGGTIGTVSPLDAGTSINVSGPAGSLTLGTTIAGQSIPGTYFPSSGTAPANFIPASGGAYTFDNGAGGRDVGHFNATLTVPAAFSWTNAASVTSVSRASGVTVTWTGGAAGSFVNITGGTAGTFGGKITAVSFVCQAPASAGSFAIPVPVLLAVPPGTGSLTVGDYTNFSTFSASGLDLGILNGGSLISKSLTYN